MCTSGEKNISRFGFVDYVKSRSVLTFITPAVEAEYGVINPPAVLGHSSVDSRKLGISTSFPPGHQAIDPALTYEWTPGVPLERQDRRTHWE